MDNSNVGIFASAQHYSISRSKVASSAPKPRLKPDASAALRECLTVELNDLNTAEDAAIWAHRVLSTKDTLSAADAECVEKAFQARLLAI